MAGPSPPAKPSMPLTHKEPMQKPQLCGGAVVSDCRLPSLRGSVVSQHRTTEAWKERQAAQRNGANTMQGTQLTSKDNTAIKTL